MTDDAWKGWAVFTEQYLEYLMKRSQPLFVLILTFGLLFWLGLINAVTRRVI